MKAHALTHIEELDVCRCYELAIAGPHVGGSFIFYIRPSVARATTLAARGGDIGHEDHVCFSSEIISTGGAFATDLVLSFESLDYVTDHIKELNLFEETSMKDSESPRLYPPSGLQRADLEVLSR